MGGYLTTYPGDDPPSFAYVETSTAFRISLACMTALLSLAVASLIGSVADAADTEGRCYV